MAVLDRTRPRRRSRPPKETCQIDGMAMATNLRKDFQSHDRPVGRLEPFAHFATRRAFENVDRGRNGFCPGGT